jgi:hypothetical protein
MQRPTNADAYRTNRWQFLRSTTKRSRACFAVALDGRQQWVHDIERPTAPDMVNV